MATGFLSFLSCRNDAIIILSLHGVNEFLHIYAFYVDLFAFYLHMSCVYCFLLSFYQQDYTCDFFAFIASEMVVRGKEWLWSKRKALFSAKENNAFPA